MIEFFVISSRRRHFQFGDRKTFLNICGQLIQTWLIFYTFEGIFIHLRNFIHLRVQHGRPGVSCSAFAPGKLLHGDGKQWCTFGSLVIECGRYISQYYVHGVVSIIIHVNLGIKTWVKEFGHEMLLLPVLQKINRQHVNDKRRFIADLGAVSAYKSFLFGWHYRFRW